MKTWLKDRYQKSQELVSSKFSAGFASLAGLLAENDLLKWSEEMTKSAATIYDKALDAEYLRTSIGGGQHRLFDGGHDLVSAWERVKDASNDDAFSKEVYEYVIALWKDVTTPMGLPFQTLDKASFDAFADKVSSWNVPGLDREYLVDLLSFDAFEILSSGLGVATAIFALKKDDQEKLAEILGSLGIVSIISANPIMGLMVILISGYAYFVKQKNINAVAAGQGAVLASLSCALFSLMGLPLLIELGIVLVATSVTKKHILRNEDLHQLVIRHWKGLPDRLVQVKLESLDEIIARLKSLRQVG